MPQEDCTPVELQFYDSMYGEIVEPFTNMTVFQTQTEDLSLGFLPSGVSLAGGQVQNSDFGIPLIRYVHVNRLACCGCFSAIF